MILEYSHLSPSNEKKFVSLFIKSGSFVSGYGFFLKSMNTPTSSKSNLVPSSVDSDNTPIGLKGDTGRV